MLHGSPDALDRQVAEAQVKVRQMGVWAPNHPVEYGGLGLSMVEHGLVSEALGRSPLGHLVFGTQAPDAGNVEILHAHATDEQRERFLRPLVAGEIRSCFSMTEPEMPGSNPVMMGTTAVADGDDYVINGQKWFTSSADGAAFAIVMAVTEPRGTAASARQHDHRPDRHSRLQPGSQRQRDGPRRVRACQPCRGELPVVSGAAVEPARRGGQRLRDRPGAARSGPDPSLHALARHRGDGPSICSARGPTSVRSHPRATRSPTVRSIQHWVAELDAEIRGARLQTLHAAWMIDRYGAKAARDEISAIKFSVANTMLRRSTPPSRCTARSASPMTRSCRTGTATSGPLASTTAPTRSTRPRSAAGSCNDTDLRRR